MNLLLIIPILCDSNGTMPGSRITRSHINLMALPWLQISLWEWGGESFVGGVCLVYWHSRKLTVIFIMNLFRWLNRQASIVGIPQALWRMAWFRTKVRFGTTWQFAASHAGLGLRLLGLRPWDTAVLCSLRFITIFASSIFTTEFLLIPIPTIEALLLTVFLEFVLQIDMLINTNWFVFFVVSLDGFQIL